jgi:cysteine synthase
MHLGANGDIVGKCEFFSAGGSVKDRIAKVRSILWSL